ncbi:hypothetical protein APTSU1_000594100 [Apodemus speciosus]|uniref:Uncharacterized protein n=1 Tax=Apodemus speciosus TaxID=105296 RepID=A0ABQ0EV98_APOSI
MDLCQSHVFETRNHSVAQADLKLIATLLPKPLEYWVKPQVTKFSLVMFSERAGLEH